MEQSRENIHLYQQFLLDWWQTGKRTYPWRINRTPYRVAVSEFMLQRTKADQVMPVYQDFVTKYPTLNDAKEGDPVEVKMMMLSLGLAWRAEKFVNFVKEASRHYGEELPVDVEKLKALPGIGDYSSAAISCFAGGRDTALVDTNIVRVIGRIFGLKIHGEARRRSDVKKAIQSAVYTPDPISYHYAVLDFGAKVCTALRPKCSLCPFSTEDRCDFFTASRSRKESLVDRFDLSDA